MVNQIKYFFNPSGVALIGASSNPRKLSNGVLANLKKYGYQGEVYPINPKADEILGFKCYSDISEVPDPIELAVIMLPVKAVLPSVIACGKRGLKAVTVISGGFKEVGPEGADLERQCVEAAHEYGMRMIGPNCVGTIDLFSGLNTTFIEGLPDKGGIGFISQSGAVCGSVVNHLIGTGVGFSIFASLGNEADVSETDLIEYLAEDENTKVIAAYVEAIMDGERFVKVAREVTKKKPIVLLKAGQSEAGERAVSSHTGSLAGSFAAYQAAFKQTGVIEARSLHELFDISMGLANQPLPKGNRAAIITNAGGPAALLSDSISKFGIELVNLEEKTLASLRARLNPSAQVENPIDMLGGATEEEYEFAIKEVIKDKNIDIVFPINVPTSLNNPEDMAEAFVRAANTTDKTMLSSLTGDSTIKEGRSILHKNGVPMYAFPEFFGPVIGGMKTYAEWLQSERQEVVQLDIAKKDQVAQKLDELASNTKHLGEAAVKPLLADYGIQITPGKVASTPEDAVSLAEELGYPVVMKIVSSQILHKSDAGGVKLNLKTADEVKQAFNEIMKNAKVYNPDANIEGILVNPMVPAGHEMIIGMRRDPQFGPLVMFGMGGVYVELFTDITFRIAPMSRQEAREMIMETKAGKLLSGIRGEAPADIDAVVDCIIRLGQISLDFPQIQEIEVNPLFVYEKGQGVMAVDARAILADS